MTDAIVLAGGGTEPGLGADVPNKGFLQISGRPLVDYVVQAVQRARGIGRIAVVGPPGPLRSGWSRDVTIVSDNGGQQGKVAHPRRGKGAGHPGQDAAPESPVVTRGVVGAGLAPWAPEQAA